MIKFPPLKLLTLRFALGVWLPLIALFIGVIISLSKFTGADENGDFYLEEYKRQKAENVVRDFTSIFPDACLPLVDETSGQMLCVPIKTIADQTSLQVSNPSDTTYVVQKPANLNTKLLKPIPVTFPSQVSDKDN